MLLVLFWLLSTENEYLIRFSMKSHCNTGVTQSGKKVWGRKEQKSVTVSMHTFSCLMCISSTVCKQTFILLCWSCLLQWQLLLKIRSSLQ